MLYVSQRVQKKRKVDHKNTMLNIKYEKHKTSNMIWLDVIWEWAEILSLETSLSMNNTIQSFKRFFLADLCPLKTRWNGGYIFITDNGC